MRSGWIRSMENFLDWLFFIRFVGGGFENVIITDGFVDVLMVCIFFGILNFTFFYSLLCILNFIMILL